MKKVFSIILILALAIFSGGMVYYFGGGNSEDASLIESGETTDNDTDDNNNGEDNNGDDAAGGNNGGSEVSNLNVLTLTNINVRSLPNSGGEIIAVLPSYIAVEYVALVGNWYEIKYNGSAAYITANSSYSLLLNSETAGKISGKFVKALTNVNIRVNADASSEKIGMLSVNEKLLYVDTVNNWYQVIYNGEISYISSNPSYTKITDGENETEEIIDNIIAAGMAVLGTPYEYGAARLVNYNGTVNSSFTGESFDCSSFVQYAFYTGGEVILKLDSRSQSQEGLLVEEEDLQRGDLIFMWSSSRQNNTGLEQIGHVAIYLGNDQILHTWGTGGVRIQEYTSGWKERFILARRMVY